MPTSKKKATEKNDAEDPALKAELEILEQDLARNRPFVAKLLDDPIDRSRIESQLKILQSEDGEESYFVFRIERGGPANPGHYQFDLYPWWLGDWAKLKARQIHAEVFKAHIANLMIEQPGVVSDDFLESEKFREMVSDQPDDDRLAELFAVEFISRLQEKVSHALVELEHELHLFLRAFVARHLKVTTDDGVDQYVKENAKVLRVYLKKSIANIGKPKWEKLRSHYDELLPKAEEAKEVYKKHRTPNWQAMIKAGFPDFDEDQIKMLDRESTDTSGLSKEALEARAREDYSLPAHMALEQAARRCGMLPFKLGPRRIRDLMANGDAVKSPAEKTSAKTPNTANSDDAPTSPGKLDSVKIH